MKKILAIGRKAAVRMLGFEQKVESLRRYESLVFTICNKLLANELAACKAAELLLCRMFRDNGFWTACEAERNDYLVKEAKVECLRFWRENLLRTS